MIKKIKHVTILRYTDKLYIEASTLPKVFDSPSALCDALVLDAFCLFGSVYVSCSTHGNNIRVTEINLDTFTSSLVPKKEAEGYFIASYDAKDVMKLGDFEYVALKDIEFHQKYHNIDYVPSIKIEGRHYVFLNVCTKESPYYITKEA